MTGVRRCANQGMTEPKRTSLSVQAERTLLVGALLGNSSADPADPLGELRSLARTAGAAVVDEVIARPAKINPGIYIGSGKAQEIAQRVQVGDIHTVIFDNDLSPAQIRELEKIVCAKVLDRSELILDIVAAHARTAESRLQVELAQLEYTYPRLTHMWPHLERIAGGAAAATGGIGTRGPGEKQIEIDRRLVQKRVSMLKGQIDRIDRRKTREVRSRGEQAFTVCLVGYTNAGKSTLMNRLTNAGALVADQLFSTLDTKTRRWDLGDGESVLLSDTVGFLRDLPHHLVASFRATLEEAIHADLLLHIADASHDRVEQQMSAAEAVLAELGCGEHRRLLVLNKIDRITDPTIRMVLAGKHPEAVFLSAATGEGLDELTRRVAHRSLGEPMRVTLRANAANGRLMQYIAQHAQVQHESFTDSTAHIEATMAQRRVEQLRSFGGDVQIVCCAS